MDDDATSRAHLGAALRESGYEVVAAADCAGASDALDRHAVDLVISDVMMAGGSGFELLDACTRAHPETAVVLVTGFGSIEAAVEAVRKGAYDYLTKPLDLAHLELVVEKALAAKHLASENQALKRALGERYSFGNILGRAPAMQRVFEQIERAAPSNATVLIGGESGAGKELIASAIHFHSSRRDGPFVKVNCVALAEGVFESELFGHEKGAFTGAHRLRKGRIELADGGTLFLDEIGDLSPAAQLKLLRVLQEREVERVGSATPIAVDIRLLVATNKDLAAEVAAGRFREELYYRIRVVTIEVPPLRERREDIPLFVERFVAELNGMHGKRVRGLTPAAMRHVLAYDWPGNVRELRNCLESLVVMSRGDAIEEGDLPSTVRGAAEPRAIRLAIGTPLVEAERLLVLETLQACDGNKARAARTLGIGKKTLYRKLYEYGVLTSDEAGTNERCAGEERADGAESDAPSATVAGS